MRIPLKITWRHMEPSPSAEEIIRERANKLEHFYDDISRCDVVVEMPHKHHVQGNLFAIRIDITVPGKELVVQRSPDAHQAHEDPYVAIRDAFDAMRRQLEDYSRTIRGKVKTHEVPPHGEVFLLDPEHDYGKLLTPDGREIYFHRNSVVDGSFDELAVGTPLRFVEELGEKGPQASSVYLIGKHHPTP
ncbi:MAG: HPF/RaiA family ribosome-associated protein [Gammaproteobacteria bacterium]|nr:HPF/RaiA family ribosome-associated protein [Gammaproteobacteria bacterium]MDH4256133.1 HPF/RaiA family ribosome-associated protein [Gammaproteobacteria bacterium]MDH5310618.1 HPF/RaiA family ribosome-associated protein [Gammaproteobacteria bacterium]